MVDAGYWLEATQGSQLRSLSSSQHEFLSGTSWAFSHSGSWIPRRNSLGRSSPGVSSPRDLVGSYVPSEPALAASEYHNHYILLVKQGTKMSSDTGKEN